MLKPGIGVTEHASSPLSMSPIKVSFSVGRQLIAAIDGYMYAAGVALGESG